MKTRRSLPRRLLGKPFGILLFSAAALFGAMKSEAATGSLSEVRSPSAAKVSAPGLVATTKKVRMMAGGAFLPLGGVLVLAFAGNIFRRLRGSKGV